MRQRDRFDVTCSNHFIWGQLPVSIHILPRFHYLAKQYRYFKLDKMWVEWESLWRPGQETVGGRRVHQISEVDGRKQGAGIGLIFAEMSCCLMLMRPKVEFILS
jgi:hypothetical protein